jgi:hypothetical protein
MRTTLALLAAFGPLLFSNFISSQDETQILSGRLVEGEPIALKLAPPEGTQTIIVVASFETPCQFGTNGAWNVQRKTQVLFRGTPQSDPDTGALFKQSVPVPWLDCTATTLWAKHFGSDGKLLGAMRIGNFSFQPGCIEKAVKWHNDDGELREYERAVVVCRTHQRGFVLDATRQPIWSWVVSTGKKGHETPLIYPGAMIKARNGKLYEAGWLTPASYEGTVKSQEHGSMMYQFVALEPSNVYGLHGTPTGNYGKLGKEASLGCIRGHQSEQKTLLSLIRFALPQRVPTWVVDHP